MEQYYVAYNPYAGNGTGKRQAMQLKNVLPNESLHFFDLTETQPNDWPKSCNADTKFILTGGDGTINRFLNSTDLTDNAAPVYYYPAGSGNDFWKDVAPQNAEKPIRIDNYLEHLPTVEVQGNTYRFINGVGYGIDGYCCEVGDKMRAAHVKKVNYTSIAIKGLLFHFHPVNATVTVDGKQHHFKRVWLAPTMNGRYYGGGMMPTPSQNRNNPDGTLSTMIMHDSGKLRTLMIFPGIFSGKHLKHRRRVTVLTGRDITVEFDRPCPLQIDGETISNVRCCHMVSGQKVLQHQ